MNNKKKPVLKSLGKLSRWLPSQRPAPPEEPSLAASVKRWVETLPRANPWDSAKQLRPALEELNRADRDPYYRLDALDAMRDTVYTTLRGLERDFLGKPLSLPGTAREAVALSNSLNRHLCTGYWKAAAQLAKTCDSAPEQARLTPVANPFEDTVIQPEQSDTDSEEDKTRIALSRAVHRALTDHSGLIVRCYQLYDEPPAALWLKLYQMFMLATKHKLLADPVVDEVAGDCSVQHAFLRPLLLACAPPQTLSQSDTGRVFRFLGTLNGKATITSAKAENASWLFRLSDGSPPLPGRQFPDKSGCLGINTRLMIDELQTRRLQPAASTETTDSEERLPATVLRQLEKSWQGEPCALPARTGKAQTAQLALGLYATHFFAAGDIPFLDFIEAEQAAFPLEKPEASRTAPKDAWSASQSRDARIKESRPGRFAHQELDFSSPMDRYRQDGGAQHFPLYPVSCGSPNRNGLYSLIWSNREAVQPRVGNIAALRTKGSQNWSIVILRSLQRRDNSHSLLGVEVLAEQAQAFSARALEAGLPCGHPVRVLLFPQGDNWQQGLKLLAPNQHFSSVQSLRLSRPGQALRIKLGDIQSETPGNQLFDCQLKSIEKRPPAESAKEANGEEGVRSAAKSGGRTQSF